MANCLIGKCFLIARTTAWKGFDMYCLPSCLLIIIVPELQSQGASNMWDNLCHSLNCHHYCKLIFFFSCLVNSSVFIFMKTFISNRFFVHRLSQTFPLLPILGVVDWYIPLRHLTVWFPLYFFHTDNLKIIYRNPAGLAILCTYKFGSVNMGLESYRYGN